MKNKKLIIIVITVLTMPIVINGLMSIQIPWAKGEVGDWISFYGSYIGALLGALVAFQVTKIQIKSQEDLNKKIKFNEQLSTLIILKVEIEELKKSMMSIKDSMNSYIKINNITEHSVVNIDNPIKLTVKYWDSIEKVMDIDLLKELVKFKSEYEKISESLGVNKEDISNEIAVLANKSNTCILSAIEKQRLEEQLNYLKNKMNVQKENKRYSWAKIMDNSIYNMLEDIINKIDNVMYKIENN